LKMSHSGAKTFAQIFAVKFGPGRLQMSDPWDKVRNLFFEFKPCSKVKRLENINAQICFWFLFIKNMAPNINFYRPNPAIIDLLIDLFCSYYLTPLLR